MSAGRVESLQMLAARKVREMLAEKLEKVDDEEAAAFELRREELLKRLEAEKASRIRERKDELLCGSEALHLQELVGTQLRFCDNCTDFFEIDFAPCCSIEGCQMHNECPCQFNTALDDADSFYDDFTGKNISMTTEQGDSGGWYWGEDDCWICKATFCKYHFFEHYVACRKKVSFRCGFRPKRYVLSLCFELWLFVCLWSLWG